MSEQGLESQVMDAPRATSPLQAGVLLREAREAQGLHIAALAVSLKVPVKKLEALEGGQFDQLPDMVFVRSLALSVCRALRVDPAPIMACLPEPHVSQFKIAEPGLNTTFKDSAGASHRGLMAQISSPTGLGVLFLMIAIAVILAWPDKSPFDRETVVSKEATEPVVVASEPQSASAMPASAEAVTSSNPVASSPVAVAAQTTQAIFASNPLAAVSIAAVVPAASAQVVAASSDAFALPSVLELTGHGESWVEVTDGAGQSRLRKLLQSGEVVRVAGQLPLSVTVGRADKVSVSVRGKSMDLTPVARENVARFEVK